MKKLIGVHAGEITAGKGSVVLASDAKNECLVIAAYDAVHKIGGLAHAFFQNGKKNSVKKTNGRILDSAKAVDKLMENMSMLGAQQDDIEVCLVTGENVPHQENDVRYQQSIKEALDLIGQKRIRYRNDTVSDAGDRHVFFDIDSGVVSYK